MFLICKDKMINLDSISQIRIQGSKLQADFKNGNGTLIYEYQSVAHAEKALEYIGNSSNLNKNSIFIPDDIMAQSYFANDKYIHRNINGAKTHGKGGS